MKNLEELITKNIKPYLGIPLALSGGVDSSLLAALIKPKFAISVELPEGKHDEIKYSKLVAEHLGLRHIIVKLDDSNLDEDMEIAVKAIGRVIPHFNIFPLYQMYKKLNEMGETELVLGDGPDETMSGYARDLIISYLYKVYDFPAFLNYKTLIDKILPPISETISRSIGIETDLTSIMEADIVLMRPDMDDMSNALAKHFGITNHRPYQDNQELDDFMRDLPEEEKIHQVEYGKYALRKIAEKYLPLEIAWRKGKVGGPVYPVNAKKGWLDIDGEFGKTEYIKWQKEILQK
ncbi:MAG: hypothetical protein A2Y41_13905 [Spirochaetes bacterium GWB1_36_13]|nr:MAG: hypothetical protein A2Y41_13905 [Spirochaetes bacterium GWB1_36_13]